MDFALPYPISDKIIVHRDKPEYAQLRSWQIPADAAVCCYQLPVGEDGEVEFPPERWASFAEYLLATHPDCSFSYVS